MFLSWLVVMFLNKDYLPAQTCAEWPDPVPFSDSLTDKHYATLVNIPYDGWDYFAGKGNCRAGSQHDNGH